MHYLVWGIVAARNSQRNSEKNQAQRTSKRKPTKMRKKWDSTMDKNTVIHRKQQEEDR